MSAPFTRVLEQTYHRRRISRFAVPAVLVAGAATTAWVIRRWGPSRVAIEGESMAPALRPGDWAFAVRSRKVGRGDVVLARHPLRPGIEMVKRVTAAPGERAGDQVLRENEWFVEGDRAETSIDSRQLGPVEREHIVARVVFVYWPPRRWGPVRSSAR